MANAIRFHVSVADDLADAVAWYDSISPGLGNRFRHRVNSGLDAIEAYPESFARISGDLRVARIVGFPYLIVFEFSNGVAHILGLFHAASDPRKWRGRKR